MIAAALFLSVASLRLLWLCINRFAFMQTQNQSRKELQKAEHFQGEKVSLIVANKNNLSSLKLLITSLLRQTYPHVEIVVVDDFSSDGSWAYLQSLDNEKIKVLACSQDVAGKKQALTEAIGASTGKWLLLTDADCLPASDLWVSKMMQMGTEQRDIILGLSPLQASGSFVSWVSAVDSGDIARQYITAASMGQAYMGVGRNLMYRKSIWMAAEGFESHKLQAAGDDDLQIQAMKNEGSTVVCLDKEAFTKSPSPQKWKTFLKQKSRHLSVSPVYTQKAFILAGLDAFLRSMFWISLLVALVIDPYQSLVISSIFLLSAGLLLKPIYDFLDLRVSVLSFPVIDFILAWFYPVIFVHSVIRKNQTWN